MTGKNTNNKSVNHKKIADVYSTNNYEEFKEMKGNRPIKSARISKIKESIKDVGYVMNPIVVNENMEVIDGQGRLAVLKELGLPVYYVIAKGAGTKECIALNCSQTNWGTLDYIKSYSSIGNESYTKLLDIYEEYKELGLKISALSAIAFNEIATTGYSLTRVKNGELHISDQEFKEIKDALDLLLDCIELVDTIPGSARLKQSAIVWCFRNTSADRKRLVNKICENIVNFRPVPDVGGIGQNIPFLEDLEGFYNKGLQNNKKIFFTIEYKLFLNNR